MFLFGDSNESKNTLGSPTPAITEQRVRLAVHSLILCYVTHIDAQLGEVSPLGAKIEATRPHASQPTHNWAYRKVNGGERQLTSVDRM